MAIFFCRKCVTLTMRRPFKFYMLSTLSILFVFCMALQISELLKPAYTRPTPFSYPELVRIIRTHPTIPSKVKRPPRSPHPKTNIHFQVNHGCASGTVSSLLAYYGLKHELKIALRNGKSSFWPVKFERNEITPNSRPNMLVTESIIDDHLIDQMLGPDVVHITTVCKSNRIFFNTFDRLNLSRCFGKDLHSFLVQDEMTNIVNEGFGEAQKRCPELTHSYLLKGLMTYGFGIEPAKLYNFTYLLEQVDQLQERYEVVILPEKMDESLILMRDYLGWNMEDIITFEIHHRARALKSEIIDGDKTIISQFAFEDALIYERLKSKTMNAIHTYNEYLNIEVKRLRKFRLKLQNFCIEEKVQVTDNRTSSEFKVEGMGVETYLLRDENKDDVECLLRSVPLDTLREYILDIQRADSRPISRPTDGQSFKQTKQTANL